jgi:hypothetical protein
VIDVCTPMFAALLISAGAVSDRVGAKRCTLPAWRPSWRRRPRGLAPTIGFLIGWRAVQGSAAAVVLSASRQVGGTLAVAVFGALIAQRAFLPGMRASLLIAVVVLSGATAASFALPRHPQRENELTGLGG